MALGGGREEHMRVIVTWKLAHPKRVRVFFNGFILIQFACHKLHSFEVYNLMAFSAFTVI